MKTTESPCDKQSESFFDKYSSSIERINIPLPNFKFYHRASDEYQVDDSFVGRKHSIRILSNWLRDEETKTGAYLVTGYRGMGKSSFVGKVLNDLTLPETNLWYILYSITVLILVITAFIVFNLHWKGYTWSTMGMVIGLNGLILLLLIFFKRLERKRLRKKNSWERKIGFTTIKVNLGHEILNERELLSLVAKNVLHRYQEKYNKSGFCFFRNYIVTLFALSLTFGAYYILHMLLAESHWVCLKANMFFFKHVYVKVIFCSVLFLIFWRGLFYSYDRFFRRRVIPRLIYLNERIEAVVSEDDNPVNMGSSYLNISFNAIRRKSYPQASVREIEQELIDILDEIAHNKFFRCRLVFVFDELDKLDPDIKPEEATEKNRLPEFEFSNSGFSGGAASRVRKQNVLNFLSKLKFFLTTAKCKFIFISGRELYDAYLADVSDREFAVSSIFNGVLYINSFLSEEGNKNIKDVSTLTENYLCKKLLHGLKVDEENDRDAYTLGHYYKYMSALYQKKGRDKRELEKAMLVLYQFSLYLSHVCNGSPKKITIYFEKYVRNLEFLKKRGNIMTLCSENGQEDYYLSFSHRSQLKIGFVHYMAFPVIQAIINRRSEFGDKLLISASFLVNHIYKHHNSGFSWRNMEYIPELMEVNKTPELRDFIGYIIDFLSQSHIRSTVSGLYRYKFPMKIIEEISLNSKYSEEISAIFNFTLDESLSVKKHYDRLLQHYARNYSETESMEDTQVIASIYHILGDLYMADEDYSQAILEYKTCGQIIENKMKKLEKEKKEIPASLILFYVRNTLKLGCVYEKRNTWDPAFVLYNELVDTLVQYKNVVNNWIGNTKSSFGKSSANEIEALTPEQSRLNCRLSLFDDIQLTYLPSLMKLAILEKMEPTGITLKNLTELEAEFKMLYEGVRVEEKYIIAVDFFRKVGEILYYKNGTLGGSTEVLKCLYYNGASDEKLSVWEEQVQKEINNWDRLRLDKQKDLLTFRATMPLWFQVGSCKKQYERLTRKGRCVPCCACMYYSRSMSRIIQFLLPLEEQKETNYVDLTRSLTVMSYLLDKDLSNKLRTKREDFLYIAASTMDGFAGVMLSCADKEVGIRSVFLDYFFQVLENEDLGDIQSDLMDKLKAQGEVTEVCPIERSIIYYWDAAELYKYAGHRTEAADCTKKILRLLFAYLRVHKKDRQLRQVILKRAATIRRRLLREAIISLYSRYEYMNLPEMQKIRNIFNFKLTDPIELNRLTIFPDIEEFCYLYYALLLNCGDATSLHSLYRSRFMTKYRVHSTLYERILNMQYKALFNRHIFHQLLLGNQYIDFELDSLMALEHFGIALLKYLNSRQSVKQLLGDYAKCFDEEDLVNQDKLEFLEFLFYDSHLCLSRVIDYTATNSDSTLFTNVYIGNMYRHLFEWNHVFNLMYHLYQFNDMEDLYERKTAMVKYLKALEGKMDGPVVHLLYGLERCVHSIGVCTGGNRKMEERLKQRILDRLDLSDLSMLEPAYHAEMAIKYYTRSMEMHSEGRAYKNMIRGLHVLDDDYNNDTCQFEFALERYMINSEYISENMNKLKNMYKYSSIYFIDSYEKEVNK